MAIKNVNKLNSTGSKFNTGVKNSNENGFLQIRDDQSEEIGFASDDDDDVGTSNADCEVKDPQDVLKVQKPMVKVVTNKR